MSPRKRTGRRRIGNCLLELVSGLSRRLELGIYITICVVLYSMMFRKWLPEDYANIIFWLLVAQGFSGQSMDWVATLTRGILKALLGLIPE